MADPMELDREMFLGDTLLGQSQLGSRNKARSLGNSGLDNEELVLLGRGGDFLVCIFIWHVFLLFYFISTSAF